MLACSRPIIYGPIIGFRSAWPMGIAILFVAPMLGSASGAFADGGSCTVTVSRELPAGAEPAIDDIPISSMEGLADEKVDVTARFKADHECKHRNPEAILEKESLTWSIESAKLAAFAIPPAKPPAPVDVARKFNVAPTSGKKTKLTGKGLDTIGDYTVEIKVKAHCEWTVEGKKETADDEATVAVTFHVYTVFLGVHAKDFKQDDDFVMLRDLIGEKKVAKDPKGIVDKHENVYPFREECFATILGNPAVTPVQAVLSDPTNHYEFEAPGALDVNDSIAVPKLPDWEGYAIRGIKRSAKVDDVVQIGAFAGKEAKDKGTVFGFEGTVRIYDFHPYKKKLTTKGKLDFQYLAVDDPDQGPAFRATCTATVVPAGCCDAPQVQNWEIGYLQNVTFYSNQAHWTAGALDNDIYLFDKKVDSGTQFKVPDHVDGHIPFPGAKRDHSSNFYGKSHTQLGNCGQHKQHKVQDSPDSGYLAELPKAFPTPGPPPIIQAGLIRLYFIDKHELKIDFIGWCAARHTKGGFFVPLDEVTFELRVEAQSLDAGQEQKVKITRQPGFLADPPITDGGSMKEYLDSTSPTLVDGPATTVFKKP